MNTLPHTSRLRSMAWPYQAEAAAPWGQGNVFLAAQASEPARGPRESRKAGQPHSREDCVATSQPCSPKPAGASREAGIFPSGRAFCHVPYDRAPCSPGGFHPSFAAGGFLT